MVGHGQSQGQKNRNGPSGPNLLREATSNESVSNDSSSDGGSGGNGTGGGGNGDSETIGGTRSGPHGANLFVYHLPKRFTDRDLFTLFARVGNIISAKVYVDKQTQESKCFGFVSFKHAYEASMAIKQLNGYQVHHTL